MPDDPEAKPPAQSPARILLVEDNPAVSRVTAAMLKAGGYVVDVVGSGDEAVRAWRATPRELLVTDVALPDISGVKLVEVLRADNPQLRVLFVTGYSAEQLGADLPSEHVSVLTKPFRHAELLAKVKALLASG
jgi:two-component system cell cycle sensor histidine kinase/response regulator CckA